MKSDEDNNSKNDRVSMVIAELLALAQRFETFDRKPEAENTRRLAQDLSTGNVELREGNSAG